MYAMPGIHRLHTVTDSVDTPGISYVFGTFRLIPSQQVLLDGDARVSVGSRVLDLLTALVERRGELVTKQELMARAWPRTIVEESNLKVHITALRKALSEGPQDQRFVATVVGRGYKFVAPVERSVLAQRALPAAPRGRASHNVPAALVRPIGRAETIRDLLERLTRIRLLTLAGPGGIGKTIVALAVAQEMMEAGEHDVWFVDLSRLSDASLVPQAIATAVGLTGHAADLPAALANFFRRCERPQLVILDSCEHVIDAAAVMAELMTLSAPQSFVLATSREPLRAVAEHIYRLEPFDSPPDDAGLTMSEALRYPAVELFMERAVAVRGDLVPTDADAPVIARICRRLDGIALAIELAATRLSAFGVNELLDLLDDRFSVLAQGRRTAPKRQRTLLATLDWSYQLLPDAERIVLRRLGIFSGTFALGAAAAVVSDDRLAPASVIDAIASLVAKSMLCAQVSGDTVRYRMLDTTRDYALRKLTDEGELERIAQRHSAHLHELFARTEAHWRAPSDAGWADTCIEMLDDLHAALNRAFSPDGDVAAGIALTVAAIPAWTHAGALDECRHRVERALSRIEAGASASDPQRMKLYAALAASTLYTCGALARVEVACGAALSIAERIGDTGYRLRCLYTACSSLAYQGRLCDAAALLGKFRSLAHSAHDTAATLAGRQLSAFLLHHMGRQDDARNELESFPDQSAELSHCILPSHGHIDGNHAARAIRSDIVWLQGAPERALRTAQLARADSPAGGHVLTTLYVLLFAVVPIALCNRDLCAADDALRALREGVAKHGLTLFDAMTSCLEGALLLEKNDPAGLTILSDALARLEREPFGLRYPWYAGMYAKGLLAFGHRAEARTAIDVALAWSRAHDESWCTPELLRIEGDIQSASDPLDADGAAEALYRQAITLAQSQTALSFELRAAMGLARLKHRQRKTGEASDLLRPVVGRFTERFATSDLKEARDLLDALGRPAPGRG
jgi:predicted ATPase/DNA-binding winged helix-turn-helix (wHTH) protein